LNEGNVKNICFIILGVLIVGGGILIILGFSTLEATELGLDYSSISKNVDKTIYQNGLHFLGIGHSFIRYPKMVQTIEFSRDRGADLANISSRTKDGLEVTLEISFQYQILDQRVYDLFQAYGQNYQEVFQNVAIDILTEETTGYTAYDFFWKRLTIKDDFEKKLKEQFVKICYADIKFLQLRSVDLPNAFENAIQETEVKKQDINIALAEKKKVQVEVDTLIKAADYQKDVTINIAKGEAKSILQQNDASVESYKKVQDSQTNAYKNLKEKLTLENKDLLNMIKTQQIRDYDGSNLAMAIKSPEPETKK